MEFPDVATFLYRLGRLAFRRRGYVALLWLAVLAAVGLGALRAPGTADEEFSTPGIESQKAYALMQERNPHCQASPTRRGFRDVAFSEAAPRSARPPSRRS